MQFNIFPELVGLFWSLTQRVAKMGRKKDIFNTKLKKNVVVGSIPQEGKLQ